MPPTDATTRMVSLFPHIHLLSIWTSTVACGTVPNPNIGCRNYPSEDIPRNIATTWASHSHNRALAERRERAGLTARTQGIANPDLVAGRSCPALRIGLR
jgi:hypothetical protein